MTKHALDVEQDSSLNMRLCEFTGYSELVIEIFGEEESIQDTVNAHH
jgi:hypothetical protein